MKKKEWMQKQEIHQVKTTKKKHYNAKIGGNDEYQIGCFLYWSLA
jgi:hypothetical protein